MSLLAVFIIAHGSLSAWLMYLGFERLYRERQDDKNHARRLAAESYQPDNEGPYR